MSLVSNSSCKFRLVRAVDPVIVPTRDPVIVPVREPVIVPVREPVIVPVRAPLALFFDPVMVPPYDTVTRVRVNIPAVTIRLSCFMSLLL